ncbi:MAG: 6-phosphofructokinase [Spirochaetia bacterium]|nr:6-phosphofructokinase [Spirochaetia bacterium]
MKRIAVMTTGGDAPGMNPAIRAVVRTAIGNGLEVAGIEEGYSGLLEGMFREMDVSSVGGIINRGGTILRTVRSKDFHDREIRQRAYIHLESAKIDGVISIGGDGSRRGLYAITKDTGIPTCFIPASIDNDVYGTDYTIGYDTAVNVGLDAIDRIRDTAGSHERTFIVEVMGREHGFLALEIGLTGGAEVIMIPEFKEDVDIKKTAAKLIQGFKRGKSSNIIVMAEGVGLSSDVAAKLEKITGLETRYTVLGYIQRGGTPTAMSRKLGLMFGYEAVKTLKGMKKGDSRMVGICGNKLKVSEMKNVISKERAIDAYAYKMNKIFSL